VSRDHLPPRCCCGWEHDRCFVVVVIGILAYATGAVRPLKAKARWMATAHATEGQVVVVNAPLKSRTRNPMTVFDVGLAKDPGWPRQLRAHFHDVDLTRFHSSVNNGGSAIAGHPNSGVQGRAFGNVHTLWRRYPIVDPCRKVQFLLQAQGRVKTPTRYPAPDPPGGMFHHRRSLAPVGVRYRLSLREQHPAGKSPSPTK
jgi:hypothetical protein